MLTVAPRSLRICGSGSCTKSLPNSAIEPDSIFADEDNSRMIDSDVTLFPDPLSPTMPSVRPASTRNEMSSTARTTPSSVWKNVRRF
jgi:hypothetical protein